jgi:hypothetical protein
VLFAEYYSYQARGEAMFTLQPADQPWFDQFLQEAQALWDNSSSYDLSPP